MGQMTPNKGANTVSFTYNDYFNYETDLFLSNNN